VTTRVPEALADIIDQAREMRERFPELYAFLATRERALDRARAGMPRPDDIEAWLVFDAREHMRRYLLNIPAGICDLARIAERSSNT
jgi:hypothetical protein